MPNEKRYTVDCRQHPGSKCTLSISGTEREVIDAAIQHATTAHAMPNNAETRNEIRNMMKEETARQPAPAR